MTHYSVHQETYELIRRRGRHPNAKSDNAKALVTCVLVGDLVKSAPSHCNKEEDHMLTDRRAGYDAKGRGHTDVFNQYSLLYLYALGLRYFKQHPHFSPDSSKP